MYRGMLVLGFGLRHRRLGLRHRRLGGGVFRGGPRVVAPRGLMHDAAVNASHEHSMGHASAPRRRRAPSEVCARQETVRRVETGNAGLALAVGSSGGMAGVIQSLRYYEIIGDSPLDLTKVRMQAAHDASMLHSMATTVRTAGVFGLWDGISGTLLRQLSYSLVRFAAYEDFKKRLTAASDKPPSKPQLALAGALAGAAGGLVGNPADVILVRMQGDAARPPAERYGYRNCLDGLWKIVRNEGPAALARGWAPNVVRASLMNASQLDSYDVAKAALLNAGMKDDI
ncbi:mitochondrial carrier, partial [Auricularia subglabra TFB-10046 SS5]